MRFMVISEANKGTPEAGGPPLANGQGKMANAEWAGQRGSWARARRECWPGERVAGGSFPRGRRRGVFPGSGEGNGTVNRRALPNPPGKTGGGCLNWKLQIAAKKAVEWLSRAASGGREVRFAGCSRAEDFGAEVTPELRVQGRTAVRGRQGSAKAKVTPTNEENNYEIHVCVVYGSANWNTMVESDKKASWRNSSPVRRAGDAEVFFFFTAIWIGGKGLQGAAENAADAAVTPEKREGRVTDGPYGRTKEKLARVFHHRRREDLNARHSIGCRRQPGGAGRAPSRFARGRNHTNGEMKPRKRGAGAAEIR